MARNTKHGKSKNRSGNPAVRAGTSHITSLAEARADRAFAVVVPAFTEWLRRRPDTKDQEVEIVEVMRDFFGMYGDAARHLDVTALEPDAVEKALGGIDDLDPMMGEILGMTVHLYVHYLFETGAWTGTEADLSEVLEISGLDHDDELDVALPDIVVPALTDDEAWAEARSLPLWQRAVALLGWIGAGREVTGTGVLRLKDIEEAAACVGDNLVGRRRYEPRGDPDAPRVVTTMLDAPRLMSYWKALANCGLIQIGATTVRPGPDAATVLAAANEPGQAAATPEAVAAVRATRAVALSFYHEILFEEPEWLFQAELQTLATGLFVAASSATPPNTKALLGAAMDKLQLEQLTPKSLRQSIRAWADEGLLILGDRAVVPPVLRQMVLDLVGTLGGGLAAAPSRAAAERGPSEATYQLKIQIDGIRPPVWRRVEVPAETTLDELHEVIQRIFRWEDYHLHMFHDGDPRGTTYGPFDPDADHWGDPPVDETTVRLVDLLSREKDRMKYEYDFGDSWEHTITLEKVLPPLPAAGLPNCGGGRGLAPQEDSGGPWGWMDILAAAEDPSHPEHVNYRDWLGLADGETVDPEEFDVDEANEELEDLRP
ncbi:plasmid pRiA4b ORF-3 family protein [Specibacter cremeus]|uniref:plasmid pRiA4b ORF-3 family protein n=1 Tax=Specibacter cremeus TaxID=1629051 RepID=UPI00197B0ABF|nr:plasmid pRiA4b ORF-3 family protein [Specibacter cremeus]